MRKIYKTLIALFIITFSFSTNCEAETMTNYNDLIENGKVFDKNEVTVVGEAIGEPMKRGGFTWVNVSDGSTAIGIWIKSADAATIKVFGDYKHKGDIIEITGIFNRACIEHGGDMDIHSKTVKIIETGHKVNQSVDITRLFIALFLTIITALLSLISYRKKKNLTLNR